MTIMTDELMREMKSAARKRIRIIRKAHGLKYGDGSYVRCMGRLVNPQGKVYYVYDVRYGSERDCHTGLFHYDLFTDEVEETYRHATLDEMFEIMFGHWEKVLYD